MLAEALQSSFDKRFMALFTRARLRSTEVALVLSLERGTVSDYKSYGTRNCKELTRKRLEILVDIVHQALDAKDLPFEDRDITGKINRLSALKLILRKYKKRVKT